MKECNEATKLADDISGMISEKTRMSGSGSKSQRHYSVVWRKITLLETRLDSLESLLSKLPSKQSISALEVRNCLALLTYVTFFAHLMFFHYRPEISLEILEITKELNRRKDILSNLRTKMNQMANTLNMSNFAN
ncbi:Syntaxin-52 [Bienertia sinuspersici]